MSLSLNNCFLLFSQLFRKINGHEITWTLGYAYKLLAGISRVKYVSSSSVPKIFEKFKQKK